MGKRVFITGGTGFLGRNWIPEILNRDQDTEIYALTRTASKVRGFLENPRIHLIDGDVVEENVIRNSKQRQEVTDRVQEIYHAVSSTSFAESERKETFNLNLNGTKNMLNLAKQCKGLERFVYISTAYVENRRGLELVPEDLPLIPHGQLPAGNPYEESKILSEELVRNSELDWSILRPGIFSGDSRTGFTGFDNRMGYGVLIGVLLSSLKDPRLQNLDNYWALREQNALPLDIPARLKGYNEVTKNFMFIDDIVGQTEAVARSQNISKKVFHILTKTPITTKQMLSSMGKALGINGFEFAGDLKETDLIPSQADYGISKRAAYIISRTYAPYFARHEPFWKTDNTDKCLDERGYQRIDMTPEKFDWLMNLYVKNELKTILNKFQHKK